MIPLAKAELRGPRKTLSPKVYGSRYTAIYSIDVVHSRVSPYILTAPLPGIFDMSFTNAHRI
jgi:hypothetical protein